MLADQLFLQPQLVPHTEHTLPLVLYNILKISSTSGPTHRQQSCDSLTHARNIYIHIYIYTCIHTYRYVCARTHTYTHTHSFLRNLFFTYLNSLDINSKFCIADIFVTADIKTIFNSALQCVVMFVLCCRQTFNIFSYYLLNRATQNMRKIAVLLFYIQKQYLPKFHIFFNNLITRELSGP